MLKLVNSAWIFIILWTGYEVYSKYEEVEKAKLDSKSQIPTIQKSISIKKKKKKRIEEFVKDIDNAKSQIELVAQQIEKIQRKLPSDIPNTEILELVKKLARDVKLQDVYLSRGQEVKKEFYFVKKFTLKAKGTYLQMILFYELLSSQELLLNVSKVEMARSDENNRGRFQILELNTSIEAFRYNQNHKVDRGYDKIESESKDKKKKS